MRYHPELQGSDGTSTLEKMTNSSLRVVPWTDWEEWATLRAQLHHGDLAAASATAALYRMRRPAALPLAVQSTVALRTLLVAGARNESDSHARRLGLAMALVRLVNGMTDRIQPRADGAAARSVHSLAKALALPPILVELRHQATHNALPRLDALEDAACLALQWLEAVYWVPQAEAAGLPPVSSAPPPSPPSTLPSEPEKPKAEGESAPTPQNRWHTCDSAEEWRDVPIGLSPGETAPARIIGVDVSSIVGEHWQPRTGSEDEIEMEALEDQAPVKRRRVLNVTETSSIEQMMRELDGEGRHST